MKWEKSFEFSAPVADVWEAFTNRECEQRVWDPENAYQSGGAIRVEFGEVQRNAVLSWRDYDGEDVLSEMTVVFNETETGSRITITSDGFAIPDFLHEGRMRGWTEMLWDLELFFRTGKVVNRLYSRKWGRLGMHVTGDGYGLTVIGVGKESPAAAAGMTSGDVVVRAAGAPVFELSDLWLLESVLPPGADVEFEFFRGTELKTGSGRIAETVGSRGG